jgi:hypothetical protein
MLGIFGMGKEKTDRFSRDAAKPASPSHDNRDDESVSRDLPGKDRRKQQRRERENDADALFAAVHQTYRHRQQEKEEWEVSGDAVSLRERETRTEQTLFLAALHKVGEQMIDWDLPVSFLHDTLSALCRLLSLPSSAFHDVLVALLFPRFTPST